MSQILDLTGQHFTYLTVISFAFIKNESAYWNCRCQCGTLKAIKSWSLRSGRTKSCGCVGNKTHGMTSTRFFRIWTGIKNRCLNENCNKYIKYGGSGIKLYSPWETFLNFKNDMYVSYLAHVEEFGEKDTSIDRIDSRGNYEPTNVKWSTKKEQNRNRCIMATSKNYDSHLYWQNRLRNGLRTALLEKSRSLFIEEFLGCSRSEFRKYIESKFGVGMSWDNYGRGFSKWQLDHIIGCNNFDLSTAEDRLKCFNYQNLRPMWYEEHKKKSVNRLNMGV